MAGEGDRPAAAHGGDQVVSVIPEWRRRREAQAQPVYGDWWRRRHHCSDGVVLGERHRGEPAANGQPKG